MKIIDRYILRGFLFSFMVVLVSMIALTIMIDMVINYDQFFRDDGGGTVSALGVLWYIVRYYFYRLFEYFQLLCGAAMLVAAAFTIARLNRSNEVVAMKASGISIYRLAWPIIAAGMVLSGLYVVNQELIIPSFIEELSSKRSVSGKKDFEVNYVSDSRNSLIYAPKFVVQEQALVGTGRPEGKVIIILRNKQSEHLSFITADRADYRPQFKGWALQGGQIMAVPRAGEPIKMRAEASAAVIDFYQSDDLTPASLMRMSKSTYYNYLSFNEMRKMLGESSSVNPRVIQVAMHSHFSKPLLNLILLLLGLPFVVGKEGKNYFASVSICIGLFIAVLGTEYVTTQFGTSGDIPPVLAVYLPILIFTPLAIISLDNIRT